MDHQASALAQKLKNWKICDGNGTLHTGSVECRSMFCNLSNILAGCMIERDFCHLPGLGCYCSDLYRT